MMEVLLTITSVGIYFNLSCLLLGIYKPWLALWWMDKQNRRLALTYYGSVLIALLFVKYLIVFFWSENS